MTKKPVFNMESFDIRAFQLKQTDFFGGTVHFFKIHNMDFVAIFRSQMQISENPHGPSTAGGEKW